MVVPISNGQIDWAVLCIAHAAIAARRTWIIPSPTSPISTSDGWADSRPGACRHSKIYGSTGWCLRSQDLTHGLIPQSACAFCGYSFPWTSSGWTSSMPRLQMCRASVANVHWSRAWQDVAWTLKSHTSLDNAARSCRVNSRCASSRDATSTRRMTFAPWSAQAWTAPVALSCSVQWCRPRSAQKASRDDASASIRRILHAEIGSTTTDWSPRLAVCLVRGWYGFLLSWCQPWAICSRTSVPICRCSSATAPWSSNHDRSYRSITEYPDQSQSRGWNNSADSVPPHHARCDRDDTRMSSHETMALTASPNDLWPLVGLCDQEVWVCPDGALHHYSSVLLPEEQAGESSCTNSDGSIVGRDVLWGWSPATPRSSCPRRRRPCWRVPSGRPSRPLPWLLVVISSQNNQSSHSLVVEWFETRTCQTLRSRIITTRSSLLRSDLPPVPHPNLRCLFPCSEFDRTRLTSLVPLDRLTESPATLTPDETQAVIRYHLCSYRRCKRNHLLCSSSYPFEASSNGSLTFSSLRSYLNRYPLPF